MQLVIKVKGVFAPAGSSQKLYNDALVDEGTLVLHDFSNANTLDNFSFVNGSAVNDLADKNANLLGINNGTVLDVSESAVPVLTSEGKGVDVASISLNAFSAPKGIVMGDSLSDYITEEQPRILWLFWVRPKPVIPVIAVFSGTSGAITQGNFLHARLSTSGEVAVRMASGGSGSVPTNGQLIQMAVEYQGAGLPLKRYVNGEFSGEGTTVPTTFGVAENQFNIGSVDARQAAIYYYRGFITDLDRSPYTAAELVKRDWDYCNGIGEFAGKPTKRPFIDAV